MQHPRSCCHVIFSHCRHCAVLAAAAGALHRAGARAAGRPLRPCRQVQRSPSATPWFCQWRQPVDRASGSHVQYEMDYLHTPCTGQASCSEPVFSHGAARAACAGATLVCRRLSAGIVRTPRHCDLSTHRCRLFSSVAAAWRGCLEGTSDVKELVPEFFYEPEFLRNADGHALGMRQVLHSSSVYVHKLHV
jgi:Beige/BEACH domain